MSRKYALRVTEDEQIRLIYWIDANKENIPRWTPDKCLRQMRHSGIRVLETTFKRTLKEFDLKTARRPRTRKESIEDRVRRLEAELTKLKGGRN